jgi:hypothetical protein
VPVPDTDDRSRPGSPHHERTEDFSELDREGEVPPGSDGASPVPQSLASGLPPDQPQGLGRKRPRFTRPRLVIASDKTLSLGSTAGTCTSAVA